MLKVEATDNNSNITNSSIAEMTWDINATDNLPPLVSISNPNSGANITLPIYITVTDIIKFFESRGYNALLI